MNALWELGSPQLRLAITKIDDMVERLGYDPEESWCDVLQEAYQFPSEVVPPLPSKDSMPRPCDCDPSEEEDIAYTISSVVQLWLLDVPIASNALDWVEVWGNIMIRVHGPRGEPLSSHTDSSMWLEALKLNIPQIKNDILRKSEELGTFSFCSSSMLHSRFQLIYTSGLQQHLQGFPDRWTITQQILGLVNRHLCFPSTLVPHSIECDYGPCGSFPHIRILRADGGTRLTSLITNDVIDGRLPGMNFSHLCPVLRGAICDFISRKDKVIPSETAKMVEKNARQNSCWDALLLRGLLANDILLFVITERRWRVDYGLDLTRTSLAVPYRAKDTPAPTSEFGHPDITILLTCLSYYYAGLSEQQLRRSFEVLLEQDDPSADYARWLEGCIPQSVPDSLRTLSGINIRSPEQWDKDLVPLFTRNQAAIDYHLSRVVFPKYAKEFPWKISGSSWDLAEKRDHLTSGE